MKTNILTLFLALSFLSNAQTIPIIDSIFEQQLINLGHDVLHDGYVWIDSISSIDTLIITGHPFFEIDSLDGIEHFSNLQYLDCSNNNIDSLNLNQNTNLKHLNCSSNSIQTLIIDSLYALTVLDCSFNVLSGINLSGNPGLTKLECFENDLNDKIKRLKVDGGATKNNFLMQFQTDISNVEIQRPENIESTALGAALLSGIGSKYWSNIDFLKNKKINKTYFPKLKKQKRITLLKEWQNAIKQCLS